MSLDKEPFTIDLIRKIQRDQWVTNKKKGGDFSDSPTVLSKIELLITIFLLSVDHVVFQYH